MIEQLRKNIRYLRKDKKYSLNQLALILGVSRSLISNFESGNSGISIEVLIKISLVFNVKIDNLIFKDLTK